MLTTQERRVLRWVHAADLCIKDLSMYDQCTADRGTASPGMVQIGATDLTTETERL